MFKVLLSPNNEILEELEHSLHIIIDGSILPHTHSDEDGITEGYREWNPETGEKSSWSVVGAGMPEKTHEVKYQKGIRVIEGSKRGNGPGNWPDLHP